METGLNGRALVSMGPTLHAMRGSARVIGVAFVSALFIAVLQVGSIGAEPTGPGPATLDPRPPEPALFRPVVPDLFRPSEVRPPEPAPATLSSSSVGSRSVPDPNFGRRRGDQAVATALRYVGAPYRWGGMSPAGFDCSGFVSFVYSTLGITLPRDVPGQLAAGLRVAIDGLLPGDVLVFQNTYRPGLSHVGIYLGDGRFVHAADERQGVTINAISDGKWNSHLYGASRPVL
jgi:cell wall-associated NlpC family hydrolase